MDLRTRLNVFHFNGSDYVDFSRDSHDFKRDSFNMTLNNSDSLYIGFRKAINAVYIHFVVPNVNSSNITLEYYSSSGWAELIKSDDTKGLTRSGFITWDRPIDAAESTINGTTACFLRITSDVDTSEMQIQAINIILSDDNDICAEVPALIDSCFYQQGQTSHILHHVSAKNYIVGRLRGLGYIKTTVTGEENINEWDILDIYELRQSSVYYAIAQIYFNLSDNVDDQYWSKYQEYIQKFEEAFKLGSLRIDTNDNGQVDTEEKRPTQSIRWVR